MSTFSTIIIVLTIKLCHPGHQKGNEHSQTYSRDYPYKILLYVVKSNTCKIIGVVVVIIWGLVANVKAVE